MADIVTKKNCFDRFFLALVETFEKYEFWENAFKH